jgi:hypothetical protein
MLRKHSIIFSPIDFKKRRSGWLLGHVDGCPAIHHLETDSIKSVEAPVDLYIRILMVELMHTTLFL